MNKEDYNIYCADVMGYIIYDYCFGDGSIRVKFKENSAIFFYEPYDDLNQAADVFDKLMSKEDFLLTKWFTYDSEMRRISLPLKEVVREFIMSKIELAQDETKGE